MAVVKRVSKKVKVSVDDVIKYQIMTYCFFNKIQITNSDLNCLTELAKNSGIELTKFCELATTKDIYKSAQSARNAITKVTKKNLVIKNGVNKKTISISDDLKLQTDGTIFLDFKILGYDSQKI
tara:strand:- start:1315 stop:1686 length:372 start_codon:yes stop_codon:yes gene_type:complete